MKRVLIFILLILNILNYGCSMPIENYNMVLLFGIDKDVKTGGYEVTFQLPKMTKGGGEGSSLSNETFSVSGKGKSIELAVKDAYIKSSRVPFLGHIQAVLIGEDMGRDGIIELINLFERDPKYTLTPWIFTVDGKAKDVLETKFEYDTMPAFVILHITRDASRYSLKFYAIQLNKFIEKMEALPHATLMGLIKLNKDGNKEMLKIAGASTYKDGKLVGMLDEGEAVAYNWLLGRVKNTDIVTKLPSGGATVNVGIEQARTSIRPVVKDNRLVYRISVRAIGYVEQQSTFIDFAGNPSIFDEINREVDKNIETYITSIVKKAQDQRVDFLGFEKVLEHTNPTLWEQTKENWDDIFPNILVEVNVDTSIKNTGWILINPKIY
ncbi:MAG: Ger(x)C family spore germination protein [Thermoanaerobacteraceae bacterium]|nr:Ger(x)C family spore germination protein [Thermoanaerobacteraceae bacterium]